MNETAQSNLQTSPSNDLLPQPTPPSSAEPRHSKLLLGLAIVGVAALIGNAILFGFWWHHHTVEQHEATNAYRQKLVQQGLIQLLSAKTLQQHGEFTDTTFRDIEYSMQSDFSDVRSPQSKGSITVGFNTAHQYVSQTLQFVAYDAADGAQELYFRMADGNQYTNAPTNWYRGLGRDIRALKPFANFWWLKFGDLNSNKGYITAGYIADSPHKEQIKSIILTNTAYQLGSCNATKQSTWCGGTLDTSGLRTISSITNATSYVFHDESDASKFTFWINNDETGISRAILTSKHGDYYHDYWNVNKPVDVSPPKQYQDAPILGGYRTTIDAACSNLCQQDLARAEADRAAGKYY